jgi:hypothetical protein
MTPPCLVATYIKLGFLSDPTEAFHQNIIKLVIFVGLIVVIPTLGGSVIVAQFDHAFDLKPAAVVDGLCNQLVLICTMHPPPVKSPVTPTTDPIAHNHSMNNFMQVN